MAYRVINMFTDLQDDNYEYNPGDIFPRDGMTVSKERLRELSGSNNRQRRSLIEKVNGASKAKEISTVQETTEDSQPLPFEPKQYTKTEINRMSTAELQQLASDNGFENAYETSGGELKKQLIEYFGL